MVLVLGCGLFVVFGRPVGLVIGPGFGVWFGPGFGHVQLGIVLDCVVWALFCNPALDQSID